MQLQPGPMPKYYQLSEILRTRIINGEFPPDKQLPTEDELCRLHHISRGTVRRAMDVLENEGLIRREQGRGIFAESPRPTLLSFTLVDEMIRQADTKTLIQSCIPATEHIAKRLKLNKADEVIHIAQLHLIGGQPTVYEERFLARGLCPGLLDEDLDKQSVHNLLIDRCRLPLIRVTHMVEIRKLSSKESQLLGLEVGASAFSIDRLTDTIVDGVERPAVFYRAIYRGDEYQFLAAF